MKTDLFQLATQLGAKLKSHNGVLTTAESCTGGGIAEAITRVPGSSAWFDRGFITYSYPAKIDVLGVKKATLDRVGAVSQAVAIEMAEGALTHSAADVALAVTGIAGPDGGTPEKPVGTVWFAWAFKNKPTISERCVFLGDREAVRNQTIVHALNKLVETAA